MSVDESLSSASLGGCSVAQSTSDHALAATAAATVAAFTKSAKTGESSLAAARKSNKLVENSSMATKPKRPLSAYNLFFRRERELLLESLPSRNGRKPKRSHGKINFNDLAKTIAAKWKDISPEEKEEYEKVAAIGREKYVKLAKEWKKQQRKLAKQKKRQQTSSPASSTAKVADQSASTLVAGPISQRFVSNEHPSVKSNTLDDTMTTGKVASSRFQQSCTVDSNPFPASANLKPAPKGSATSVYEPIPAFDDLQANEPVLPASRYEGNQHHHQAWTQPTDMGPAMQNGFAFDNYNQHSAGIPAMLMTAGASVRASPARNTYAFDHSQNQLQRREMMLRPSTSLPHMASVNVAWTNGFNNSMDPPRRLRSLPLPSAPTSLNATWDNSMRMMQQSLPFPPPASGSMFGGPVSGFPPLFETSQSSLDYYSSTEQLPPLQQQQQQQQQTDNYPDLQPDPLPYDFTASSQQTGSLPQTNESTMDQNEYMDLFGHL